MSIPVPRALPPLAPHSLVSLTLPLLQPQSAFIPLFALHSVTFYVDHVFRHPGHSSCSGLPHEWMQVAPYLRAWRYVPF
jgi:hypothetical protein